MQEVRPGKSSSSPGGLVGGELSIADARHCAMRLKLKSSSDGEGWLRFDRVPARGLCRPAVRAQLSFELQRPGLSTRSCFPCGTCCRANVRFLQNAFSIATNGMRLGLPAPIILQRCSDLPRGILASVPAMHLRRQTSTTSADNFLGTALPEIGVQTKAIDHRLQIFFGHISDGAAPMLSANRQM